jgi:hypothetical protein
VCLQVVERDGQYQEADGKVIDTATHRYAMQFKASDISGPAYISAFNEQVRPLCVCVSLCVCVEWGERCIIFIVGN